MTYAADLAAVTAHDVRFSLIIDGLPIMWGTRAGMVYDGGVAILNFSTPTSNDGIVDRSVSIGELTLDHDLMMVKPGTASLSIRGDATWDKYMRRRATTQYELTADLTETATSVSLNTTSGLSANDYIFVNRETMQINDVNVGSVDVTRNACALAIVSRGGMAHATGAVASTAPRYLKGRICELRAWLGGDESTVLRHLVLADSPRYSASTGLWTIGFDDIMRVLDRRIAVGFNGARAGIGANTSPAFIVGPEDMREFAAATAEGSLLLTDSGGGVSIEPIKGRDLALSRPCIDGTSIGVTVFPDAADLEYCLDVRRCYAFTSRPMLAALQVLLSDRGLGAAAGTNHATYDVLYGRTSTSASATRRVAATEPECRMGAAIPANLVDVTALAAFVDETVPGWAYVLGAKGDASLVDFLREVAWALRIQWYWTSAGKLSARRIGSTTRQVVAASVTDTNRLRSTPLESSDDESGIVHTVSVKCNLDPASGDFMSTYNAIHPQERETFKNNDGVLEVERPGAYVEDAGFAQIRSLVPWIAPTTGATIVQLMDRVFARRNQGCRKYRIHLPWAYSALMPGDVVSVTCDQLLDFTGGTLSAAQMEVVSVKVDPYNDPPVVIDCEYTWQSWFVSPTLKVSSVAYATNTTITLATSTRWDGSTFATTPGRWFAAGWKVKVLDASASPPYSTTVDGVVASVGDAQVVLTGLVKFGGSTAIAAGDLIVQDTYADSDNTTANANQSLTQRGYAFGADSTTLLGTAAANTYG